MKGTIARCLAEMVTEKFGKDKWESALEKAGLKRDTRFMSQEDIDDTIIIKIVEAVCKTLDVSWVQAADAFGDYWSTVYAPKIYKPFYDSAGSAREFLLKMDQLHVAMTKNMPGAHPPRFEFEWQDDKTLIMKYISPRGLIDFVVSLAKGIGHYYKTNLKVTKRNNDSVEIVFP